jgi:hypothetical protein
VELAATLGATEPPVAGLRARTGPLNVTGPEQAVVALAWHDAAERLILATEIRVLGINRGAAPVTELLVIGHGSATSSGRREVLAWAHRILMCLAGPRRPRAVAVDPRTPLGGDGPRRAQAAYPGPVSPGTGV